jgi:hypothetical protein
MSQLLFPSLAVAALALAACATAPEPVGPAETALAVPELPPAFRAQEIVGRWGYAAYHKPDDRARTEANARGQCNKPYVISAGSSGGVVMHLADQPQAQELRLKGAPGGKTYIGPAGEPPGSKQDREVLSFDGRVLVTRFVDPEVDGRYGTSVYVRCGARAAA